MSGASDAALPDVVADEEPPRRELAGAGAGKLAAPEPDVRVQDACRQTCQLAPPERQDEARELCTQGADQSAERSCAARAFAAAVALLQPEAPLGAVQPAEAVAQQTR